MELLVEVSLDGEDRDLITNSKREKTLAFGLRDETIVFHLCVS